MSDSPKKKVSYLKKSIYALVALILLIAAYLVAVSLSDGAVKLSSMTSEFSNITRVIRWGVIAATIAFWDGIVAFAAVKYTLSDERVSYAKSLRWRAAIYFVLFEFFIVEAIPSKLLGG